MREQRCKGGEGFARASKIRLGQGMKADPRDAILKLLGERSADKTICPSEAARAIGGEDWRDLMPTVHAAARALAEEGIVEL